MGGQGSQQAGQRRAIGTLGWGQGQVEAVAQRVDYGVDFGAEAAATASECFSYGRTFFWLAAALWALTVVKSTSTHS